MQDFPVCRIARYMTNGQCNAPHPQRKEMSNPPKLGGKHMQRLRGWIAAMMALLLAAAATAQTSGVVHEQIQINAQAPGRPFPHFWEEMFGSGHANLAMRAIYRQDLRVVKSVTDFD